MQVSKFYERFLVSFDYSTRKEIAQQMKEQGELCEPFSEVLTMSLDGTHRIMKKQCRFSEVAQISYKLKDIAYNSIVKIFNIKLINLVGCINEWLVVLWRVS